MYSLDNVYEAIDAFYGPNPEQSTSANTWLTQFQRSEYAWSVADSLLSENRTFNSMYFGAQTMRQKIVCDFRQLPESSYENLRDSLIQHLKRLEGFNADQYSPIVNQLSLALADLYLQVPQWIGYVAKMVDLFTSGTAGSLNIMMTLLKLFPEELYSKQLKLGANRREAVQQELASNFDMVVTCLTQILMANQNDMCIIKRVIQCIASWINNPLNNTVAFSQCELLSSMIGLMNSIDISSDIYNANCEAIMSACYVSENTSMHYGLAKVLQQGIYDTRHAFSSLVERDDFDRLTSLAKVYVELADSMIMEITNNFGNDLGDPTTLDLLVMVAQCPDHALIEMTCGIWYRLSESLFQITEDQMYQSLLDSFKPYIMQIIESVYKHCQLDLDFDGLLDSRDDFFEVRSRLTETVKDVTFIVNGVTVLNSMLSVITPQSSWSEVEAAFFIASKTVGNVSSFEDEIVPRFIEIIYQLPPSSHVALKHTAVEFIGNIGEWLDEHVGYIEPCIDWLIAAATQNERLMGPAADAIAEIATVNFLRMRKFIPSLLSMLKSMDLAEVHGISLQMAALGVTRSCTALINDLSAGEITEHLNTLVCPVIDRLIRLAEAHRDGRQPETNENAGELWSVKSLDPISWLDRLTSVFKALKPWHLQKTFKVEHAKHNLSPEILETAPELRVPWYDLAASVWQAIAVTIEVNSASLRVVEHACRATRYLIRTMGVQAVHMVGSLASLIVKQYGEHPHSCFLYLGSIIVDEYGPYPAIMEQLLSMGTVIARRSFELFNQPNGFINNPDTVDDLYRLALRFVQRIPAYFFTQPISKEIFKCAIFALELDHGDAHRSVTKFFSEIVSAVHVAIKSNAQPAIQPVNDLFDEYGVQLVHTALNAAIFRVSHSLQKDIAEMLYEICDLYREKYREWSQLAIVQLFANHRLGATQAQLEEYHHKSTESRRSSEFTEQLRALCRLYA